MMHIRNGRFSGLGCSVVTILALVAFLASAAGVWAQSADPLVVVRQFVESRNADDVAGAMALVADDVYEVGGPACTPAKPCVGRDAFQRDIIAQFAPLHVHLTIVGTPKVSGNQVQARAEVTDDRDRAVGVDRVVVNLRVEVRGGKIATWVSTPDPSDPQTATFLAFQRAHAAPAPGALPTTGDGGPFASPLVDVLVGGALLALGLASRRAIQAR